MTVNYFTIGAVAVIVVLVLAFAIYKNQKDKLKLEERLNKGEMKADKDEDLDKSV